MPTDNFSNPSDPNRFQPADERLAFPPHRERATNYVAYQASRATVERWLRPSNGYAAEDLLGIFVEFTTYSGAGGGPPLPAPLLAQIYAVGAAHRVERSPLANSLDATTEMQRVVERGRGGRAGHTLRAFGPGERGTHAQLEYFSSDVELVFIGAAELRLLARYFEFVVFSGCKVDLGSKLGITDGADSPTRYRPGGYFTLKVEGKNLLPEISPYAGAADGAADTVALSAYYASPSCPPKWFGTGQIASAYLQRYPKLSEANLGALMRSIDALLPDENPAPFQKEPPTKKLNNK